MNKLERMIEASEQGLLRPKSKKVRNRRRMALVDRMRYYKVPGFSIALIDQEELAWVKGYGVMEAGGEKPVTPETIFQAASISKPVSAMVALHLVENGILDLDSDVNDMLHSWKIRETKHTQTNKVTLRGLLSHSAGLNIYGYPGYPSGSQIPTLIQILEGKPPATSKKVRVIEEPGNIFKYSGGGYVLLQLLIEDATGRTLSELAQEIIFDPLKMSNSTLYYPLPGAYAPQTAIAHNKNGEPIPGKWHIYPEQAAAGLWSTPSNLAQLVIEVEKSHRGESNLVLSMEMTDQMITAQVGIGGLGFNILMPDGRARYGHPGWNEGFHSFVVGELGTGQGFAWMANGENGRKLGREVTRGLSEALEWTW